MNGKQSLIAMLAASIAMAASKTGADAPIVRPGGYQAGLTILSKPPAGVRVFGPGLPTPPPGGKHVARAPKTTTQKSKE
jgi:hypothetical protein